jgi:hypothetical protein
MSKVNILFYSGGCKYCYNLMTIMNNLKILKNFKIINTDNNKNIPPQITAVPTLIVIGMPKMLVCEDAFKWVNSLIQIKKESSVDIQNKKNIFIMSELMNQDKNKNDPIGQEILNFSDLFTFIDNNNNPQNHNFIDPKQKLTNIFTAPELNKINKKDQTNQLEKVINNRKEEDKNYKNYMKQFHDN